VTYVRLSDEDVERIANAVAEKIFARDSVAPDKGVPSRAGKEGTCHDDETNALASSGRTSSRRPATTASRRWTRQQMEAEADAQIDIFEASRKPRTGSR
jgi:hypothetical protein